ncbi:MAG: hypothetical protein M9926_15570 [Lentimicrobium sp.]|nr:hypothetical protein [Lentimicrobium sp.]
MKTETTTRNRTSLKGLQPGAFTIPQRAFMTYVRTLQFMKTRLKGIDEGEAVHIPQKLIETGFFKYPTFNRRQELAALVDAGELEITQRESPQTGRIMYLYRAINPGKWLIDLYLLRKHRGEARPMGEHSQKMRGNLMRVSMPAGAPSTDYFNAFLRYRDELPELFFTIDDFAGRVHTPITNFHRTHRPNLLIDGSPTVGLDVTTMQPLLLGKALTEHIPGNQYSRWIEQGEDIYIKLQQAAGLVTRDEGKKRFFEILFAPPSDSLSELFGAADWITWINSYKRADEPKNPHRSKRHSNLAWLLQSTEVHTMRRVWQALNEAEIPFLSVHDEIIVKQQDRHQAESLFRRVLDHEFTYYKLNVKEAISATQTLPQQVVPPPADRAPQATAEAEIWKVIQQQFAGRLNPDVWLNPGKTSDEIYYDLIVLSADCLINYGLDITPDQYYKALKWRKIGILS